VKVKINRITDNGIETLGRLIIYNEKDIEIYRCLTLELPWKDNQNEISCIPEGEYVIKKRWSEKYKNHFHVLNVPFRDYILIHTGNLYTHTKGCILVGKKYGDINNDDNLDVLNSKTALQEILDILSEESILTIEKTL